MKIKGVKLGPTGRFPYGRANAHDEGEIQFALAADRQNGLVRIVFGKPVAWLGLRASEARQLAGMILEKVDEIERAKA